MTVAAGVALLEMIAVAGVGMIAAVDAVMAAVCAMTSMKVRVPSNGVALPGAAQPV
jgi:hypothetical protein